MITLTCIEQILKVISYIATPVIAAAALWIAWQQAQMNRQKLKVDRYERRLRVYEEVKMFIVSVLNSNGDISTIDIGKFQKSMAESDFLFGADVPKYVDDLCLHAFKWRHLTSQLEEDDWDEPEVENQARRIKAARKSAREELEWFASELSSSKKIFDKYLNISGDTASGRR